MKYILSIILIQVCLIKINAQTPKVTYDNFEEMVLNYEAIQKDLSDEDFQYGAMIISEVKKNVQQDNNSFNRADYYNVLSCFATLKEKETLIHLAFEKFKSAEGSCEYFLASDLFDSKKYDNIREAIQKQKLNCESSISEDSDELNLNDYAQRNDLDVNLVKLMAKVSELDIKYREDKITDWSKQTPLDKANQITIDSLFQKHQTYIGRSLVGEAFEYTMWSVIQHSNVEMMGRYLPIVHQAFIESEVSETVFKMLIDRFYGLKHGYQIFGSQSGFGFKLANEQQRKEIEQKYSLK